MTGPIFADEAAHQALMSLPEEPAFTPPEEPAAPAAEEPSASTETLPEFDPQYRQPFTGLLYLGALTDQVSIYGHSFTITTPSQDEMLQIGPVIEKFANTATGELAYSTAFVAAYLVKVDGQPLPMPILNEVKDTALLDRFNWVKANLRRQIITQIFNRCLELDKKVDDVLAAMGKASG